MQAAIVTASPGQPPKLAMAELLEWHVVADGDMPDADITVLLWWTDHAGVTDWDRGWRDGEAWRLAESGGVCPGTVTHWAQPEGPAA
jgi:hypothetical protein